MVYTLAQLKRLRLIVLIAVILGISGSVALNVLHAPHNIIAQVISGFPPVALAGSLELISRIPTTSKLLSAARIIASTIIGGVGGAISYIAQMDTVRQYGIVGWQSDVWPLIIDGLLIVILLSLVEVVRKIHSYGGSPTRPQAVTKADREAERRGAEFRAAQGALVAAHPVRSENLSRRISENHSENLGEKVG